MGLAAFNRMRRERAEAEAKAEAAPNAADQPDAGAADGQAGQGEGADPRAGYSVKKTGTWHALIGPDGQKVGASQRTEAEAWALLEG